jgi:hypothetical protein
MNLRSVLITHKPARHTHTHNKTVGVATTVATVASTAANIPTAANGILTVLCTPRFLRRLRQPRLRKLKFTHVSEPPIHLVRCEAGARRTKHLKARRGRGRRWQAR